MSPRKIIGRTPQAYRLQAAVKKYQIEAQPISTALKAFAAQSDMQLIYTESDVGQAQTTGVNGDLKPRDALTTILKGTNLEFEFTTNNVIVVRKPESRAIARTTSLSSSLSTLGEKSSQTGEGLNPSPRERRGAGVRLAQNEQEQKTNPQPSDTKDENKLTEIVVTAQKRVERLLDVPVPVTAVPGDMLYQSNQLRLQDYYTHIPGLTVSPTIQSAQFLAIRGVTSGSSNPTVGIMVDDVPYGGSTALGGGSQVPDFDPSDLARVEVLRGPQGTLFGANSLGGLIKFVTVDPSTDQLSGRIQGGTSAVRNGSAAGYNFRGSANVPINDQLAIRASAFTRRDPGYIDNPAQGLDGVNQTDASGGRFSALWQPLPTLSVKLSALYQETDSNGSSDVLPALGEFKQSTALPGLGAYDRKAQAYSATVMAKLGAVDLAIVSGYNINGMNGSLDFSIIPFYITNAMANFGSTATAAPYYEKQNTDKFSQEVRLSGTIGEHVDWLLGGFYTDERNSWVQDVVATDPVTKSALGSLLHLEFPTTYREYAAFGDVTVHLTDRIDVQLGARESENKQTYNSTRTGSTVAGGFLTIPTRRSDADAFTYLITPRLKISPQFMVYARVASGYRAGGPNTTTSLAAGAPPEFNPDKTDNYEIGLKGTFFDDRLLVDASAYHIVWKDIILNLSTSAGNYFANGNDAKSQGLELSLDVRPATGLRVGAWLSYNHAVLTQPFPQGTTSRGFPGDRLPFSPRFSGNFSVEQELAVSENLHAFLGGSLSYVGDRLSYFRGPAQAVVAPSLPRQDFPSYTKLDLGAGIRYAEWKANVFLNNVTDRRGVLAGGFGAFNPNAFTYIQPRTVGLTVERSF